MVLPITNTYSKRKIPVSLQLKQTKKCRTIGYVLFIQILL